MGVLLREILGTLCLRNQWSYAVFWKVGCQNPKLLIWEECCHKFSECSASLGKSGNGEGLPSCRGVQPGETGDKVGFLIWKMGNHNQVNIVGEGLVGRAAFTGNHEWILANNSFEDAHPPEVRNELLLQFSAGMQTVAVIPVSPHGVVQFGSSLAILEDMGFVNDIKNLILQLGCVPGALLTSNSMATDCSKGNSFNIPAEMPVPMQLCGLDEIYFGNPLNIGCNEQITSSHASRIVGQPSISQIREVHDNLQCTTLLSQVSREKATKLAASCCDGQSQTQFNAVGKPRNLPGSQQEKHIGNGKMVLIDTNSCMNWQAAPTLLWHGLSHQPVPCQLPVGDGIKSCQQIIASVGSHIRNDDPKGARKEGCPSICSDQHLLTSCGQSIDAESSQLRASLVTCSLSSSQKAAECDQSSARSTGVGLQHGSSSRAEDMTLPSLFDQLSASGMVSGCSNLLHDSTNSKHLKIGLTASRETANNCLFPPVNMPFEIQDTHLPFADKNPGLVHGHLKHESGSQCTNASFEYVDTCQPSSGDDLYDILGLDYKKKIIEGDIDNLLADLSATGQNTHGSSSTFHDKQEEPCSFYTVNEERSDIGTLSLSDTDHLLDAVVSGTRSASQQCSGDRVSTRTTLTNTSQCSGRTGSSASRWVSMSDQGGRELSGLPTSYLGKAGAAASKLLKSVSGNAISSSGSQLSSWVCGSSNSTARSKKNDGISKPHFKRLKPGENPRPRPKDRQMIQDRMKDLREIIPNGAKCSIDALLERTIKHMLFLQRVMKHADKLKNIGESKLISNEGGILLENNFKGGKTWAFEVVSQSMLCPIIVEDLNPPRQLLVEVGKMLCEERGLFLEIADLLRGLGLTILKGVMEAWNNNIWAQFAVEADRDVTRREVFMSLVRLLEQMKFGMSSFCNPLGNAI